MQITNILGQIDSGNASLAEITTFLSQQNFSERVQYCVQIAAAFERCNSEESLRRAVVFAERAWTLSQFDDQYLPLMESIFKKGGNVDRIKQAYKQIGLKYAQQSNVPKTLLYFNKWQFAHATFEGTDRYTYDHDVYQAILNLTAAYRFQHYSRSDNSQNKKIKIGYLVSGLAEVNSVMCKLATLFAENQDKDKYEIFICTPDTKEAVQSSPEGTSTIDRFHKLDCKIIYAPESIDPQFKCGHLAQSIHDQGVDILFTFSAMADLWTFYTTTFKPAPVTIALVSGPHAQFVHPSYDGAIAWDPELVVDSPIHCIHVPLEIPLPVRNPDAPTSRDTLGLPKESFVIYVGGRPQKLRDRAYLKALAKILKKYRNVHLLVQGIGREHLPTSCELLDVEIFDQVHLIGWKKDYLSLIADSDLVIDTYPNGGGIILTEAIALGIPMVSFQYSYSEIFDQVSWTPIGGRLADKSLVLKRDDWDSFHKTISNIITAPSAAKHTAQVNQAHIRENYGNPYRMVKRCEALFESVFAERILGKDALDGQITATKIGDRLAEWTAELEARERTLLAGERELSKWVKYHQEIENQLTQKSNKFLREVDEFQRRKSPFRSLIREKLRMFRRDQEREI